MSLPLACSKKDARTLVHLRFDRSSLGRDVVSVDPANFWTFDASSRTVVGTNVEFADLAGSHVLNNTVLNTWGTELTEDSPGAFAEGVGASGLAGLAKGGGVLTPDFAFGSSDFTLSLWWKSGGAGTSARHCALLSKIYYDSFFGPSGNSGWGLICPAGTRDLRFCCNAVTLDAPNALAHDSSYHHIAVRRSGSAWSLWVDGVQVDTAASAAAISFADAPNGTDSSFAVADHGTGGVHARWPGHYDSIGIWLAGIEDDEITGIWNGGAGWEPSFASGGPEELFYCAGTEDYNDGSQVWTCVPTLEVKLPTYSGLLSTQPASLKLPASLEIAELLASGEPFPPVAVAILEDSRQYDADPDSESPAQTTRLTLFRGLSSKGFRNPDGQKGHVALEFIGAKARLNVPLGIPATPTCSWSFMGRGCQLDPYAADLPGVGVTNLVQTVEVASIDGFTLGADNITSHGDASHGEIYTRGFVRRGDLRIGIRRWQRGTFLLELVRRPPSWWLGEQVEVFPGCDNALATCRARYDNEANFGGLGIAIPNYHPVFEVPDA